MLPLLIGASLLGTGASIYAGKKAARAQKWASKRARDAKLHMFEQTREDMAPYREVGVSALDRLAKMYDLPTSGQGDPEQTGVPDYSSFYESPDYQVARDEGIKAVEQSLAKRGFGGPDSSGAAMKALARFSSGLASKKFGDYKNMLASLAGIGERTATTEGTMRQNLASDIGSQIMGAGDARASSYLNVGSGVTNLANQLGTYALLKEGGYL